MPETVIVLACAAAVVVVTWLLVDTRHHEAEMDKLMARMEKAQQAIRDQHQDATIEFLHEQLSQLEGVTVEDDSNHTSSYFSGYTDGKQEMRGGGES